MKAAGDLAKGIYFVGSAGGSLSSPDSIAEPAHQARGPDLRGQGQAVRHAGRRHHQGLRRRQGWGLLMTIWEQASIVANGGKELNAGDASTAQMAGTDGNHSTARCPFGCADGPGAVHRGVQLGGQPTCSGTAPS